MAVSISSRVSALGAYLPVASRPVANYLANARVGDFLFISGQIPLKDGRPAFVGTIGDTLTVEDAVKAAELAALGVLAQLADATGDDLERVERCTRVGVFISCVAGFERHSAVADGASNLLVNVLGDKGRHARTAVGVTSLPSGVAVEVDAIVQLRG